MYLDLNFLNKETEMKKIIRNLKVLAIVLTAIIFSTSSFAASGSGIISLGPTKSHPDASGTAFIDNEHINVQARGLKPDSVYTTWFVNMKPNKHETGAGTAPYMFKTDRWGNGHYSAPLSESPSGKWAMIMIVLHPTGDPKDMKNMVGALSAEF